MRLKSLSCCRAVSQSSLLALSIGIAGLWGGQARAYTLQTSPDWQVELDSDLAYTFGVRADHRNQKIADNPIQQNDEYKFPNFGNITTSRVDLASELTVIYKENTGLDISVDTWKDFAYNGGTQNNPGYYAPGVSYASLSSSPYGHYSSYTNYYYNLGVELNNAFAFHNFTIDDVPVEIKVGRFTEYWGTALFSGAQAISYGQSPVDVIKAVDAPGTEVKDLFLPRGQVSVHTQLTPELALGFVYAFEYRFSPFPEGGTFLGVADPFFIGPQSFEGIYPRGSDYEPPNVDGNFGVEAIWSPNAFNGQIGFYFRQFDDVAPYSAFELNTTTTPSTYHLAYARHILLYGLSLDRDVGPVSIGVESSIRANTALNSVAGGDPAIDPLGHDGARGNTFNFVGNALYGLTPSSLWDTGIVIGELGWTHVLAVTHDAALYNAEGYACAAGGLNAGSGESDGCSTKDEVNATISFDPQWLQVRPGVDLDAPVNVSVGLHGNGQTLALAGVGDQAGSIAYSVGLHAIIRQKYNVKLSYVGYHSPFGKTAYNGFGQPYYSTGSGQFMWNDKAQLLLTLSTAF